MSSNESTQAIALKQGARPYQLAVGFVMSVAMLLVGTTGVAGAMDGSGHVGGSASISKKDCKKDGWRNLGFKNQGDCVKADGKVAAQARHGHNDNGGDNGYGGNGNGNNIGLDLSINGDNNVVNVIINFLFG